MRQLSRSEADQEKPWGRFLGRGVTLTALALWIIVSGVLAIQLFSKYRTCPGHLTSVERSDVPKDWSSARPAHELAGGMLGPFRVGIAYPWGKSASLRVLVTDPELCPMDHLDISKPFGEAQSRYLPSNVFARPDHLRLRELTTSGLFVVSLVVPRRSKEEFVVAFRRVKERVRMFADQSAQLRARWSILVHGVASVLLLVGVGTFRVGVLRPGKLGILAMLIGIALLGAGLLMSVRLVC